jgi:hypothetical protein
MMRGTPHPNPLPTWGEGGRSGPCTGPRSSRLPPPTVGKGWGGGPLSGGKP